MRIVGGKYKSRILNEFSNIGVRPTADNVREALFNILDVQGVTFLDVFCGTGAVGIEAISRGAKKCYFNDSEKTSIDLTKSNLSKLSVDGNAYNISQKDGLTFLTSTAEKFDIIFIDPPYKDDIKKDAVSLAEKVLNDNGIIVLEDEKPFDYDTPFLIKYDQRKYGRVYLSFFKKAIPKNETCLFAGTFDPVQKGHIAVIGECLKRYKNVVVGVGVNPDKQPLFSLEDRLSMLKLSINDQRVKIDSYSGYTVDYMKENGITVSVRGIRDEKDLKYEKKMASFNKNLYPEMKTELIFIDKRFSLFSSTAVRKKIEENKDFSSLVPEKVYGKIKEILNKK